MIEDEGFFSVPKEPRRQDFGIPEPAEPIHNDEAGLRQEIEIALRRKGASDTELGIHIRTALHTYDLSKNFEV